MRYVCDVCTVVAQTLPLCRMWSALVRLSATVETDLRVILLL